MALIDDLKKQRRLMIDCPTCGESFRAADAKLFDATKPLTGEARGLLETLKRELVDDKDALVVRKAKAKTTSQTGARAVTIGNVVEKIAPSLPGFPLRVGDCRALFEPIDYLLFKGYSVLRRVDAIGFVEIKSGKSRLSNEQKAIRTLVEAGRVELVVTDRPEGGEQ